MPNKNKIFLCNIKITEKTEPAFTYLLKIKRYMLSNFDDKAYS